MNSSSLKLAGEETNMLKSSLGQCGSIALDKNYKLILKSAPCESLSTRFVCKYSKLTYVYKFLFNILIVCFFLWKCWDFYILKNIKIFLKKSLGLSEWAIKMDYLLRSTQQLIYINSDGARSLDHIITTKYIFKYIIKLSW